MESRTLLTVPQFAEKHPAWSQAALRALILNADDRLNSRGERITGNGLAPGSSPHRQACPARRGGVLRLDRRSAEATQGRIGAAMDTKGKAAGLRTRAASRDYLQPNSSTASTNARHGGLASLLDRLEGVKRTGPCTWIARCPAHDDRRPSLTIRETDDSRVLVHCHAGCETASVLDAVGLTFSTLFPDRPLAHCIHPERRPFPALDVLRCVEFEVLVAAVAAGNLANGIELSDADRTRLFFAGQRLQAAVEACRA
jgi:hypothetical protein